MGNFFTKTMKNVVVGRTKSAAKAAVAGATTNMIAKALGLDDSLVGRVLMVGVPMMMFAGADDPSISEKLFGSSKKKDKKKKSRKESEDYFFSIFGDKGHKINKAIAEESGATEDEVNSIMSLFLPSFEEAIAEEDIDDERDLQKLFKDETEDVKKKSPSFAKMAMKVVF